MSSHNQPKSYNCYLCPISFTSSLGFEWHIETEHEKTWIHTHNLRVCSTTFPNQLECDEHVSSHTQTKPLKCQHCHKTFTSPLRVERHIESEHENYMVKNRSDVEAVNQVNDEVAKNRNNVVAEETNIKCTECEYRCEENIQQESHIKAMHSGAKYNCTYCEFKTNYIAESWTHSVSQHTDPNSSFNPHWSVCYLY